MSGFPEDIPQQIRALKQQLAQRDAPLVARQSHAIKGAAATIGANALREVAFGIEQAGKAGELDRAAELALRLEEEFERLKVAILLRGWLGPPRPESRTARGAVEQLNWIQKQRKT